MYAQTLQELIVPSHNYNRNWIIMMVIMLQLRCPVRSPTQITMLEPSG